MIDADDARSLVNEDGTLVSRRAFGDGSVYEREQKTVFRNCWLFLGHESQVRETGEFFSAYMGELPVIVARARDGKIHVSLNACRHRGVTVCRAEQGKTRQFVCPYHHWSYGLDGRLAGVPNKRSAFGESFKNEDWGLVKVPRVETYKGLIFGCLDPDAVGLRDYLGKMAFYLDCLLDRTPGGTEALGAPQKWVVKGNWKLPAENQVGDNYHGMHLHGTMAPPSSLDDFERYGCNIIPETGHGLGMRLMPDCEEMGKLYPGSSTSLELTQSVPAFYDSMFEETKRRLGPLRTRLRPLSWTVFPNFSIIWPTFTIRVAHPRGPEEFEIWSWCLAPADASEEVKGLIRDAYHFTFGPSGALEQEDGVAWEEQVVGNRMHDLGEHPYFYGMHLGEEGPHEELPGLVGPIFSECNARHFYMRWRDELAKPKLR